MCVKDELGCGGIQCSMLAILVTSRMSLLSSRLGMRPGRFSINFRRETFAGVWKWPVLWAAPSNAFCSCIWFDIKQPYKDTGRHCMWHIAGADRFSEMSDMETDTETERGTDIEDETDTEIETGTERDSDMETDTESGDSRSFLQYYDDLPPKLKYMIIAKLARDRRSFISWSLARRQNMEEFRKASFWIGLLESEGRTVSPKHVMKTAKLMNAFYRRAYNGVKIDEEVACVQVSVLGEILWERSIPALFAIHCSSPTPMWNISQKAPAGLWMCCRQIEAFYHNCNVFTRMLA